MKMSDIVLEDPELARALIWHDQVSEFPEPEGNDPVSEYLRRTELHALTEDQFEDVDSGLYTSAVKDGSIQLLYPLRLVGSTIILTSEATAPFSSANNGLISNSCINGFFLPPF